MNFSNSLELTQSQKLIITTQLKQSLNILHMSKLELENEELIIKDIQSNECQGKTTQKIAKNKKRIKKITASTEEQEHDTIEETDTTI